MAGAAAAGGLSAAPVPVRGRTYRLAGEADCADLRRLAAEGAMGGWVSLALEREPRFRLDHRPGLHRSMLALDADGRAVGMCSLGDMPAWIGGERRRIGYLGDLRVHPDLRGRTRMVRDGFAALRGLLHDPARAKVYLTTVVEGNRAAERILGAGLPGMPAYRRIDGLDILAFAPRGVRVRAAAPVAGATRADLPEIAAFLDARAARFAIAPAWDPAALAALPGLAATDFAVVRRDGRIVGCAALWDQGSFRQVRVRGYASWLGRARPLLNALAPLTRLPRMPPAGAELRQAYVSHLAVEGDDPDVLAGLVAALARAAARRGAEVLLLPLTDSHPLRAAAGTLVRARTYRSGVYLAHWEDGAAEAAALPSGPLHVEGAIL